MWSLDWESTLPSRCAVSSESESEMPTMRMVPELLRVVDLPAVKRMLSVLYISLLPRSRAFVCCHHGLASGDVLALIDLSLLLNTLSLRLRFEKALPHDHHVVCVVLLLLGVASPVDSLPPIAPTGAWMACAGFLRRNSSSRCSLAFCRADSVSGPNNALGEYCTVVHTPLWAQPMRQAARPEGASSA